MESLKEQYKCKEINYVIGFYYMGSAAVFDPDIASAGAADHRLYFVFGMTRIVCSTKDSKNWE